MAVTTKLKTVTLALALGSAMMTAGCEDRRPEPRIREGANQAGEQVGEAGRQVEDGAKRAGEEVGEAAREAKEGGARFIDGVREGFGGSGAAGEANDGPATLPPAD